MILQQFYLPCFAHASYLVGDESSRVAAVIDPQRDIDQYLTFAADRGLRIEHVFLTHLHADFIAGHLELRDRAGAGIYLGAAARAEYRFTPLHDGDYIRFGRVRLEALETPGHTVESISIAVYDLDASGVEPHAVFTGDTLLVGDVGRPDLRVAVGWSPRSLAGLLYDSLRTRLLALPDGSLVYPAHGAGSRAGETLSRETVSTIGGERQSNYALQPMTKAEFVDLVTVDEPDAPSSWTSNAVLNSREKPVLDGTLGQVRAVTLEELLAMQSARVQIVDTRDPAEFAAVHLAGSLNLGLSGPYAAWAGTILDHHRPIALITEPGREREAAMRLGRIGFDQVSGYLRDGLDSLRSRPELMMETERVSAPLAADRLGGVSRPEPPLLLDVRTPQEHGEKRIAGSVNWPLGLFDGMTAGLPADREVLVYCGGGYRSSIAASVLQRRGFNKAGEIAGGIAAWEAARLPVETQDAAG